MIQGAPGLVEEGVPEEQQGNLQPKIKQVPFTFYSRRDSDTSVNTSSITIVVLEGSLRWRRHIPLERILNITSFVLSKSIQI